MERMSKPKFIKEIEKSEGKERAKCGRWYIRVYGELDHKPMVELESLEMVVKELHNLEQENKNLKLIQETNEKQIQNDIKERDELREENKKLNIKVASFEGEIKGLNYTIEKLHKEIEEQEAEGGGLFDEIDYRKRECKKLKEKVETLELWLDNKEKLNEEYRKLIQKIDQLEEENENLRKDLFHLTNNGKAK